MIPGLLPTTEDLGPGAVLMRGFIGTESARIMAAVQGVIAAAPLRHMISLRGTPMSVAMTSCGTAGWVSGRGGYSYSGTDPMTGRPWPPMPEILRALALHAAREAGYDDFAPDACLINSYAPGAKLGVHRDEDEQDLTQPVVSVSLGLPAKFLFGGLARGDKMKRIQLEHGDVVVWGGATRLAYHGIDPLKDGCHPELGSRRINLTFRKAL
jgi:alkylated DNA repair protein (DNA oxidative demethylase)